MAGFKKSVGSIGYDQEEAYFYQKDRELIAKMKDRPKLLLLQGGKSESSRARNSSKPGGLAGGGSKAA